MISDRKILESLFNVGLITESEFCQAYPSRSYASHIIVLRSKSVDIEYSAFQPHGIWIINNEIKRLMEHRLIFSCSDDDVTDEVIWTMMLAGGKPSRPVKIIPKTDKKDIAFDMYACSSFNSVLKYSILGKAAYNNVI